MALRGPKSSSTPRSEQSGGLLEMGQRQKRDAAPPVAQQDALKHHQFTKITTARRFPGAQGRQSAVDLPRQHGPAQRILGMGQPLDDIEVVAPRHHMRPAARPCGGQQL